MTTILHVEDDASLIQLVEDSFAAFGFRGTYVTALDVAQAERIIADVTQYPTIELVLSDMKLPDGTGLDVVRFVRSSFARAHVPIVILSGDTSVDTVNRAYAVGANSFIGKGTRARSIAQTMTALYGHWLRDARLPQPSRGGRTAAFVGRAVDVRKRKAQLYMQIAEGYHAEREFWMDLALREGNLANVIAFLHSQLDGRELPDGLLSDAERVQQSELLALDQVADHDVRTQGEAQLVLRAMLASYNPVTFARVTAALFPVVPVAMATLREIASAMLDEIAGWIETHASDPSLREQVPTLRAGATHVRATGGAA